MSVLVYWCLNRIHPRKWCFLLFTLAVASTVGAQTPTPRQVISQRLVWFRFDSRIFIDPKWSVYAEAEDRRYVFPDAQHHLITRAALHYNLTDTWVVGAGLAYSLQSPHDPYAAVRLAVPEWRPHLEAINRNDLNTRFSLNHFYRVEYRRTHNATTVELLPGYSEVFRFRYKIELSYFLVCKPNDVGNLRWRLSNEIMLNAGKDILYNVFDQNRIHTGLNYQATKNFAFEIAYLKWFQQRASGNQYFNRDILRFIIQHQLKLKRFSG